MNDEWWRYEVIYLCMATHHVNDLAICKDSTCHRPWSFKWYTFEHDIVRKIYEMFLNFNISVLAILLFLHPETEHGQCIRHWVQVKPMLYYIPIIFTTTATNAFKDIAVQWMKKETIYRKLYHVRTYYPNTWRSSAKFEYICTTSCITCVF